MSAVPGSSVAAPDCTTERHNAHKTEVGTVRYAWHPWHDRSVLIHEWFVRGGLAVFRCSLEPAGRLSTTLEIPAWMFERAICCGMRPAERPMVDCAALLRLKALLSAVADEAVIEGRHRSSPSQGDADATPGPVSLRGSTRSVPTCQPGAGLGALAVAGERASTLPSGSNAANELRTRQRRREPEGRGR